MLPPGTLCFLHVKDDIVKLGSDYGFLERGIRTLFFPSFDKRSLIDSASPAIVIGDVISVMQNHMVRVLTSRGPYYVALHSLDTHE